MNRSILALALAAALIVGIRPAAAQQEVQVPIDEQGRIQVLDAATASRLGLFIDQYPGFHEGRLLLQLPDSAYVFEVTTVRSGQTARERLPRTAAEVAELRREVTAQMAVRSPAALLDQEGRGSLLATTTLLGLGFYGWGLPIALNVQNDETAVSLYMLTGGASFFVPWMLTSRATVSRGMADLAGWGATRGIVHGLVLHELIAGPEDLDHWEDTDERGEVALALAGSVAEGIIGYSFARGRRLEVGQAKSIGLGGDVGLGYGAGLAYMVGGGHRATAAGALAGSALGVVGGNRYGRLRSPTPGDVSVLLTAGLLGAYTGVTVIEWTDTESGRLVTSAALAGGAAGLAIGDRLVTPARLTEPQARLVGLGTLAGGALGFGVAYLLVGEDVERPTAYFTASSLGALGGFALTYRAVGSRGSPLDSRRSGVRLDLNPLGLAALGTGTGELSTAPLLRGEIRF
jgi:hypothetical protein